MRESIKVRTDNYNFKFRVSGVLIHNNSVLTVDMDDSGFLCLPGGYVELGETTEDAICREMEEEIGYAVYVQQYLGVVENFFINKYGKKMHEICFYYLVKPKSDSKLIEKDYELIENDKGHNVKLNFKWIPINEIKNYDLRPNFLINKFMSDDICIDHLIFKEL